MAANHRENEPMNLTEFVAILTDEFLIESGAARPSDCHPLAVSRHNGSWNQQMPWENPELAQSKPLVRMAYAYGARELMDRGAGHALENVSRIVAQGLTTSDFKNSLSEILRRSAVVGLASRRDEVKFAATIQVPNYRPHNFGALGVDLDLEQLSEAQEQSLPTAVMIEDQVGISASVNAYGRDFVVTHQVIQGGDGRKVVDTANGAGVAASRLETQLLYGLVESNPTLGDGGAMFHADYGNLLSAAALSLDAIEEMDAALCRIQTSAGNPVAAKSKYLVVAPEQRVSAINILHNAGLSDIETIASPELSDAGNWYMFSDPALNPAVALLYLDDHPDGISVMPGPKDVEFKTRGVALSFNFNVGVAPISRRGVVRRPTT